MVVAPQGTPLKALVAGSACVTATHESVSWSLMGAPPKAPMAPFACVSPTRDSVSWPNKELHRRPQWHRSHAFLLPGTALRDPIRSSTEGPTGAVRMRFPRLGQRF
eukprot:4885615-Pyramimonas_sp.AAC.1